MKTRVDKRLEIFNKYADSLNLLIKNGIINLKLENTHTYICPICLTQFSEQALIQSLENPLTLEDVPPVSLGGKSEILTCRKCNNSCGQKFDHHLTTGIRIVDDSEFIPGTERNVILTKEGVDVNAQIKVGKDGLINVHIPTKKNNPEKLKRHIEKIKKDDEVQLINYSNNFDNEKFRMGLLKIGYLMVFKKFGYSIILDPIYDPIREQLRNPEKITYEQNYISTLPIMGVECVALVIETGFESMFSVFSLKASDIERPYQVFIPLPGKPISEALNRFREKYKSDKNPSLEMKAMNNSDYLTNIEAIKNMLNWINYLAANKN